MITKGETFVVDTFICLSCKLGAAPLDWKQDDKIAVPTTGRWKRIFSPVMVLSTLFYVCFVFAHVQTAHDHYTKSGKLDNVMIHLLFVVLRLLIFGALATAYTLGESIADLSTRTKFLNRNYGPPNVGKGILGPKSREKLLYIMLAAAATTPPFVVITFLTNQDNPAFLYSILPENYRCLVSVAIFGALEYLLIILANISGSAIIMVMFSFLNCANFWLSYDWTSRQKCTIHNCVNVYRSIYLLNRLQNFCIGTFWTPFVKSLFGIISMVGMYISIRLGGKISLAPYFLGVMSAFIPYVVLISASYIMSATYMLSVEFKEKLKIWISDTELPGRRKIGFRLLKSMPPVKCSVGNMYFMEKGAKGTLIDWLINGTASLLLTYE